MKKTLFLSVSLATVCLLAACQNGTGKQKTADELVKEAAKVQGSTNFDIEVPSGWTRMDTTMSGLKATFLMAPEAAGVFRSNLNIISQTMSGMSGDAYFDASIEYMGKIMNQFKVVDKGTKSIGGSTFHYIHYNDVQNGNLLDQALYMVPSGNNAFLITCTSVPAEAAKAQPAFEQAISSFKIR
jgi:hypothetical protein